MRCYGAKTRSFLRMVPSGMLPAMLLDGQLLTESDTILKVLEAEFPDHRSLMPPPADGKRNSLTRYLFRLERHHFGAWCSWLCRARNQSQNRAAQIDYEEALDAIEDALGVFSDGPFFLGGPEPMLPDICFAPFMERAAASLFYYKGFAMLPGYLGACLPTAAQHLLDDTGTANSIRWPRIKVWHEAWMCRPSYLGCRADIHTHAHDLPPQMGGCYASGTPEQKAAAGAVDFAYGSIDTLPVATISSSTNTLDRLEAGIALSRHAERLISQAPHESRQILEIAFRRVAQLLLVRDANDYECSVVDIGNLSGQELTKAAPSRCASAVVVASELRRVRDRVNVPRDMSPGAALQLRAHLHGLAAVLDPKVDGIPPAISTRDRRDQDPARFFINS